MRKAPQRQPAPESPPPGSKAASGTTDSQELKSEDVPWFADSNQARQWELKSILGGGLNLNPGETITVTAGKQTFNPAKYCSFEAGPVTVTVMVTAQGAVEAYVRASAAAA